MENLSLRWSLFILTLVVVHFTVATALLKLLGIFQPLALFMGGAAWVWFAMPKINAWMVENTPFGEVWDWARRA